MQAINPNMNIGFRQNQKDKSKHNTKSYVENNFASRISLPIAVSTSAVGVDLLLNGMSGVKKRFKEDKLFYPFVALVSLATAIPQKYMIPDFFGKKEDKRIKNFLITQQAISTALLGTLIACGISQAINKKPDRKSGIIAACLSGIALAASTISNIATWKNYKKENTKA